MNKKSGSKAAMWFMASLVAGFMAGCGSGGGDDGKIFGAGAGVAFAVPAGAIAPGAACSVAGPTIPTVTTTDPTNGNQLATTSTTGVAGGGRAISASFSLSMNPATINAANFTVGEAGGAALIPASVTYNAATHVATFTTSAALAPATTYTAVILTGATSSTGTAMGCAFAWSFRTVTPPAAGPAPINLGSASTFGIMATSATTSTGATIINGDVALAPGTSQGIPPAQVNGVIHVNDAEAAQAQADLLAAYNVAKALPPGAAAPFALGGGADLSGLTLPPGVYTSGSTILINGPAAAVLDAGGNPDAVWVFQIGSSLTTVTGSVSLIGGAQAKNVFWVPTAAATIGSGTTFEGTILAGGDVTANTGATINGRILAGAIGAGTVALQATTVNVPAP